MCIICNEKFLQKKKHKDTCSALTCDIYCKINFFIGDTIDTYEVREPIFDRFFFGGGGARYVLLAHSLYVIVFVRFISMKNGKNWVLSAYIYDFLSQILSVPV